MWRLARPNLFRLSQPHHFRLSQPAYFRLSSSRYDLNLEDIHNRWAQYDPKKPQYKWFPALSGASRRGFMVASTIIITVGSGLFLSYNRKVQIANEPEMERYSRQMLSPIALEMQDSINEAFTENMRKHQRKMLGITTKPPGSAEIKEHDMG